jgi:hypothetical protein
MEVADSVKNCFEVLNTTLVAPPSCKLDSLHTGTFDRQDPRSHLPQQPVDPCCACTNRLG